MKVTGLTQGIENISKAATFKLEPKVKVYVCVCGSGGRGETGQSSISLQREWGRAPSVPTPTSGPLPPFSMQPTSLHIYEKISEVP